VEKEGRGEIGCGEEQGGIRGQEVHEKGNRRWD